MKKLWQKDSHTLNTVIESFETKDDIIVDQRLLPYDIKGSIAHAKMLHKMSILTKEELMTLEKGFDDILKLNAATKFHST